jgi:hypothetical protein
VSNARFRASLEIPCTACNDPPGWTGLIFTRFPQPDTAGNAAAWNDPCKT